MKMKKRRKFKRRILAMLLAGLIITTSIPNMQTYALGLYTCSHQRMSYGYKGSVFYWTDHLVTTSISYGNYLIVIEQICDVYREKKNYSYYCQDCPYSEPDKAKSEIYDLSHTVC
jgi:hypothetical protein